MSMHSVRDSKGRFCKVKKARKTVRKAKGGAAQAVSVEQSFVDVLRQKCAEAIGVDVSQVTDKVAAFPKTLIIGGVKVNLPVVAAGTPILSDVELARVSVEAGEGVGIVGFKLSGVEVKVGY